MNYKRKEEKVLLIKIELENTKLFFKTNKENSKMRKMNF